MTKRGRTQAGKKGGAGQEGGWGRLWADGRRALRELVVDFGMAAFYGLLEEEREALCGPRYQRCGEQRRAYRHGYETGRLVLGGRRVQAVRPRVRSCRGEELTLPSWEMASRNDPLNERAVEQVLCGVATRRYGQSLEPLAPALKASGTSRSAVSRRFVARTRESVAQALSRPLERDFPVILLDGVTFGESVLVVALGVDREGRKQVLGVVEGTTENEAVGHRLLSGLIERGLEVERARLFVIDGGKGLRRAIRSCFGAWALVQRCQVHKTRNVLDHLPEGQREWVRARLRRAWQEPNERRAKAALTALARQLEDPHPGAAASLREGLEEMLTLRRLGLDGALWRTLRSTNAIENLVGTLRRVSRNVKRWRGGSMVLRWAVAGLAEAEKRFRRVRGFGALPHLLVVLERHRPSEALDNSAQVA